MNVTRTKDLWPVFIVDSYGSGTQNAATLKMILNIRFDYEYRSIRYQQKFSLLNRGFKNAYADGAYEALTIISMIDTRDKSLSIDVACNFP